MSITVLIVAVFTGVIHFAETLALSIRLAGVKTGQVATSISFVNISFLIARMSNMLQAPLLGVMVDNAISTGSTLTLENSFRIIIFAAFIGNTLGALLIPWASSVAVKAIYRFEQKGNVFALFYELLKPKTIKKIISQATFPSYSVSIWQSVKKLPTAFWLLNILMVAIYAIGVLAALYAGSQIPELRTTASQLSGIVNGIATILLALLVDPTSAHVVDQVVRGKRELQDAKTMVFLLAAGRILATLILAQLIFIPASKYIMVVTNWVARVF